MRGTQTEVDVSTGDFWVGEEAGGGEGLLEDVGRPAKDKTAPPLHRALAFVACRAAIKAHAPLQHDEMARLLGDLSATETPYFCPHGRPIVSRLSLREIKRELGRTW